MDKTLLRGSEISYNDDTYIVRTPSGEVYKIPSGRFEKMLAKFDRQKKDKKVACWLCVLLGFLGVHRFYVGDCLKGFLLFGTFGGMLFGWLIDYLFIQVRIDEFNRDLSTELLAQVIEDTRKDKKQEESLGLAEAR